ncbi:hypothetical protein LTR84_007286 [Exophiala bonariae]|uniref:A to I editase domain-containing protein n=1 Tax=Exophiala bonariae TaxID=1690606 RepID=A0AAV9MZ09_9EURO|nr:hypothetical protein LTR84_007286 [Exophiala bonariae]
MGSHAEAKRVAKLVLDKFDALPSKCEQQNLTCVSLATGTKCLPATALPKGFNYWLLSEIKTAIEDCAYTSPFIEFSSTNASSKPTDHCNKTQSRAFRLRDDVSLYLFTTEAPCGDASMELLMNSMSPGTAEPWETHDLESLATSLQGRGHFSMLGYVRRKPARADAEPSNSKSCSDKLAVKQFMSAIAFPADLFIEKTDNAYIRTMIAYGDQYNETGYLRAFGPKGRLSNISKRGRFFEVAVLPHDFQCFAFARAAGKVVEEEQKPKVSNVTCLWIRHPTTPSGDILEVMVNGVKQGYRQWDDRIAKASVVSRRRLWDLAIEIAGFPTRMAFEDDIRTVVPTTLPTTASVQFEEISKALARGSYAQAKSSSLRGRSIKDKSYVTTALGNWHNNEEDKNWKRNSA